MKEGERRGSITILQSILSMFTSEEMTWQAFIMEIKSIVFAEGVVGPYPDIFPYITSNVLVFESSV